MLDVRLTVKPGRLVHFAELLLDFSELSLKVLHQLLVTNVLTLGQLTLCLSYVLLTTDIPIVKLNAQN